MPTRRRKLLGILIGAFVTLVALLSNVVIKPNLDAARVDVARRVVDQLSDGVRRYQVDREQDPKSLADLFDPKPESPLVTAWEPLPKDPWNHDFFLAGTGADLSVCSSGLDGDSGTALDNVCARVRQLGPENLAGLHGNCAGGEKCGPHQACLAWEPLAGPKQFTCEIPCRKNQDCPAPLTCIKAAADIVRVPVHFDAGSLRRVVNALGSR